jgi:hypothetical protein
MNRQKMNYNIIIREIEWILTAAPVAVHNDISFHPVSNPIEDGTSLTQFTQHQCRTVGNPNLWFVDKESPGQITVVFEADVNDIAPETLKLGIAALLQANTKLDFHATVPIPSHVYDKTGARCEYGTGDNPNIYF